ncbi:hypothetical protein NQ314_002025 [Rhamnusium bicolor]|uniref:Serpin domain-containing protein n=1 Tax=Rhamnusium bicolor TaxID=1586634 RepID=A0AAV8ZSW0_9CUCU|nr:hypothetical protein NQ314_002025 [Rhamnusium bicolor]
MKPMISVEIYSNSKSTENPVDQLETENSPIVEIKPTNTTKGKPKPSYESKITTKKPLTTTNFATFSLNPSTETEIDSISASVIKENITKPPVAFVPFMSNSINYSTLTTTEIETTRKPSETTSTFQLTTQAPTSVYMPVLTTLAPEGLISTWRPKPFSTIMTEPPTITDEITFTTEKPQTTTDDIQPLISYDEQPQHDLPTLADILNLNKDIAQSEQTNNTFTSTESVVSGNLTIPSIVNGQKNKDDVTTTEYIVQKSSQTTLPERLQTTENVEEDLSTLSSEYFGTKNSILYMTQTAQQEIIETTTQLPLEQSMNNAQKISATELLDQLLFTTNIYEINTELAEKTTELQTFSNEDERFESSTQEESKLSEIRTEFSTTTEEFLIKVVENTEQPTTDRTLINSIEQILSQAIVNVDKTLARVNDTQKIQDVLVNSGMKNMSEVQLESATLTSDLIGLNFNNNEENEKTTELNMLQVVASDNSNILSDSVGSLLSQVYESNLPSMTAIEQVITTEKYPTITINTTVLPNRKTDDVTLTMNVAPITEKLETSTVDSNDKYTEKSDIVFEEQETTTQITMFEREKFTTNEPTTVSYVPLNPINTNVTNISDQNYVPHLINITIISSENANIIVRNRTKPAKADLSLEQVYNEEIKMNSSVSSDFPHENEWIELYNIDQTPTSTENEKLNIEKIPNEILKAEETMSPLYNNTEESKATTEYTSNDQQNFVRQSEIPESTSEELIELSTGISTTATDESFIPIKEISKIYERPTTIIIIKRTERPVLEESTTIAPIKQNYLTDINIDTTTILDEKNLDSTTYGKKEVEITESEIEKNIPTITEIIQDDISMESTTKIITEPSIEIIIGENNKPLIEQTKQSADQQITTPFDNENNNKNENENKTPQESSNIRINITNEKIQQNNLKTGIANNLPHNKPSQTEKFNKTELPTESKPESTWTLVPTIAPHSEEHNDTNYSTSVQHFPEIIEPPSPIDLVAKPLQGFGLEDSTSQLDADIYQFAQLCNELAFGFWKTVTNGISSARSVFVSPFGATSLLAMVFLGARGATSGEMNEILRLDDMVTFNPHLIFKNVSESINTDEQDSGVASSAIIRELFSDRSKGKLLPFYKERARAFYDGYVEEASFREIGDVIRRRTNLQVKKIH